MYSISNSAYPGNCATTLAIPVIEDGNAGMAVTLPFRAQLQIGTPFSLTLDQAIQAADRHIYVHGEPPNPLTFVEDWINLLRWEVNNLWDIQAGKSSYQRDQCRSLTHEHYKRSGEILAEGIAIAFLEDRLKVSRQRFFFVNGSDARPDFVVKLKAQHRTALLLNRLRFMLEVRSRSAKGMRNLSAGDQDELQKKKAAKGAAGTLAIYCCYGGGKHRDGTSHTRIHLADPPANRVTEASDSDVAEIAIHHYLRITSQIGLWRHRDHLLRAAQGTGHNYPAFPRLDSSTIPFGVVRLADGQAYRGREFNELQELASRRPQTLAERDAARAEVQRRVRAGQFGPMVFRGLNTQVLNLIEDSDWLRLAEYRDPATTSHSVNRWVRADGLFRSETPIEPDTPLARDLVGALGPEYQ